MRASARVLVVDDEPMVRDVLSRYLERSGFEVEAVADGARALAAFESRRPDLVLPARAGAARRPAAGSDRRRSRSSASMRSPPEASG